MYYYTYSCSLCQYFFYYFDILFFRYGYPSFIIGLCSHTPVVVDPFNKYATDVELVTNVLNNVSAFAVTWFIDKLTDISPFFFNVLVLK